MTRPFGEFFVVAALPDASSNAIRSGAVLILGQQREAKREMAILYSSVNYLLVLWR